MRKATSLRRLGLVSVVVAVGLTTSPVAAHADGYNVPRSATALGAGSTAAAGYALAEQRARQAVLADGHDCTPGTYNTYPTYISPGGGTWAYRSTHDAMCVD
ncbi:hypothetical protein [Microbispora sp. CA-102843]|uniref:hypothetical protein n=1 Tax=Microbispora sp. CA-102843 TaxID=3239952 RepID=UPI003D90BDA8